MELKTRYLGLELEHPVVASASPLSQKLEGIRALEDGGASAVVLFSLFEEQIRHEAAAYEHLTRVGTESFGEALSYFPEVDDYQVGPQEYLELIRRAREAVSIPVIGSLNGVTPSGWIEYAGLIEEAGASALELNIFHIPADLDESGRDVEARYEEIVHRVKTTVSIPLAVKLGPYFSATGDMARRLTAAGADALVLFNRFYQPDFDLDNLAVSPDLELSSASEIRLPLLWIGVLKGRISVDLAATTGVERGREVMKYLLAGADAVMTTSSLLRHGPEHARTLVRELVEWMEQTGYESVEQMKGAMSQERVADPTAFERANYVRALQEYRNARTEAGHM
ncbi:MAG: dihydroorotate dehydrogenase-like protein [Gemmatimonadota bacterium]|nr:dihydroorotate dehydrogenase-like protein [Gemmatimonadota bacterium]